MLHETHSESSYRERSRNTPSGRNLSFEKIELDAIQFLPGSFFKRFPDVELYFFQAKGILEMYRKPIVLSMEKIYLCPFSNP